MLLVAVGQAGKAQSHSLHLQLGGTHFVGDVGNYAPFLPQNPQVGLMYKYNWNAHWGGRIGVHYGRVSAADSLSNFEFRQDRNLSFRSNILEINGMVEFQFFEFDPRSKNKRHTPYVFLGLGFFTFNPQARLGDEWYDLQPLGTEGQGTPVNSAGPYSRVSIAVPFGMGYRWAVGRKMSVSFEVGFRKTFTDYLDDVSTTYADPNVLATYNGTISAQLSNRSKTTGDRTGLFRGEEGRKDWYIFTGLNLEFYLRSPREKCPPAY